MNDDVDDHHLLYFHYYHIDPVTLNVANGVDFVDLHSNMNWVVVVLMFDSFVDSYCFVAFALDTAD